MHVYLLVGMISLVCLGVLLPAYLKHGIALVEELVRTPALWPRASRTWEVSPRKQALTTMSLADSRLAGTGVRNSVLLGPAGGGSRPPAP